ncbi:hypothetical protein GCK72_020165 [Caenorhabditis remanei]|uniref:Aftiphilin clathrin-binding box domain-containing protein n=1 Tax=Caenorhabditis remanei TaxID=31234 RepID=A0A6A5GEK9_CAERE|nr:hypothetical protein GCK72_020165 [Caenorhabditis remanei]KAF1753608.1 hypothetical protein GCK72_020165 [Caenorhabditis remanei]
MSNLNDDDDEWGAFDQARPSTDRSDDPSASSNSTRSQEAHQLAHQQSLEEWGAFETSENAKDAAGDDDDEWQAEFSSAAPPPLSVPDVPLENLKILEEMLDDESFWDDGYAEGDRDGEENSTDAIDIPSLFDSENLDEMSKEFEDVEKQKYSKLWLSLRVIEEAISLKFDWKQSEIRKNHFKSLKINPIAVKKETRATAAAAFDTSNLLLPTPILQPTSSDSNHDLTNNPKTSSSSPSVDSPSVPAVDFDWDTSGLTNPMNRANQSSAIIDVDFLGTNGVASAYTNPLQQDFEHFGLNGVKTTEASNGSKILEQLMSGMNGTSDHYRSTELLSLDARKLLERLPDIGYLRATSLKLPLGTNLPH